MKSICIKKKLSKIFYLLAVILVALALTGTSPALGITLSQKIDFMGRGYMYYDLAMAADGTIYVHAINQAVYPDPDDRLRLHAFHPNGTAKWVSPISIPVTGRPVIGPDGTIYMASLDDELVAIRYTGSISWRFPVQGSTRSDQPPAVASDGTIYIGTDLNGTSDSGYLYAVNPDGSQKWFFKFQAGESASCAPAIATDGTIYISAGTKLYAIWPDGTLKWSRDIGQSGYGLAIAADGTVYMNSLNQIDAVNPSDGSQKWMIRTSINRDGNLAIGADGTIYYGSHQDYLCALNPNDGSDIWKYTTDGGVFTGPVISADGYIIFGSQYGKLQAISPSSLLVKWTYDDGSSRFGTWLPCPLISDSGMVYVATWDEVLILDASMHNDAPSAASPWSRNGGNNRNASNRLGYSPTLLSPINNVLVPEAINGSVNFDWNYISSAPGYQFQISGEPSFSQPGTAIVTASDIGVNSSSFTVGNQYFWRVSTSDTVPNGGGTLTLSESQSFIYGNTLNHPVIFSPKYGATVDNPVSMAWFFPGSVEYFLQVSTDQNFNQIIFGNWLTVTSGTLSLNASSTYYMRVVGVDSNRQPLSNWSHAYKFMTKP